MTTAVLAALLFAVPVFGLRGDRADGPSNLSLGSCRPADDPYSLSVLGGVRKTLTDERLAPVRAAMNLRQLSRDSVILVLTDSLCARAAKTIAAYEKIATGEVRPVVIRIGSRLWAQEPSLRGGEYSLVYILDADANRVLGQY